LIWEYKDVRTNLVRPGTQDVFRSEWLMADLQSNKILLLIRFYGDGSHPRVLKEIQKRVDSLLASGKFSSFNIDRDLDNLFRFNFEVKKDEVIWEAAADRVVMVFEVFGIPVEEIDPREFKLQERSYIRDKGKDISLEDYLKANYRIARK